MRSARGGAAAAKQRRQKKIAIGGGVILVLLLAVQGPKTMKMLKGSSAAAPAVQPAPAASTSTEPAPGAAAASPAPVATVTSLKELGDFDAPPKAGPAHLVAFNRFAPRDPFVRGSEYRDPGLEVALSRSSRSGAKGSSTVRARAYTVVLASIPVRAGRAAAQRRAREIRGELGLPSVGVLRSSEYRSLRPGYFVIYLGRYESRAAAHRALPRQSARGARRAYTVHLVR